MDRNFEPGKTDQGSGGGFVGSSHSGDSPNAMNVGELLQAAEGSAISTAQMTVEVEDQTLSGVTAIDLPTRSTPVIETNSNRTWGQTEYTDLRLEREVQSDDSTLFDWSQAVEEGRTDAGRKRITVSLEDNGDAHIQWVFSGAWPMEFDPPTLDGNVSGTPATASVRIAFESVHRTVAAKQSGNPLRTGLLQFVEAANDGRVSNGASLVRGNDVEINWLRLDYFSEGLTVDGSGVRLLVPEGLRDSGSSDATVLWMVSGADVSGGESMLELPDNPSEYGMYWVPMSDFFPRLGWSASTSTAEDGMDASPLDQGWGFEVSEDDRVLLITGGESKEAVLGSQGESSQEGGVEVRKADAGETFRPGDTVFGVVGRSPSSFEGRPVSVDGGERWSVPSLFDDGGPAPLAGATFGLATLSSPNASVLGQSVNPLVELGTRDVLEDERARKVLRQAGVTNGESVEWLVGPRVVDRDLEAISMDLLGQDAPIRSFEGIVSGVDGPWLVGVHVSRVSQEDHVIVAGVHRHPVGTGTVDFRSIAGWRRVLSHSREYTARVGGHLEFLV